MGHVFWGESLLWWGHHWERALIRAEEEDIEGCSEEGRKKGKKRRALESEVY